MRCIGIPHSVRENLLMASQVTPRSLLDDTDDVLADRSTFVDRMILFYFVAVGLLIYIFRANLPGWPQFLVLHFFGIAAVFLLLFAGIIWRPVKVLRDWYALLFFIVGFEEVARLSHLIVPAWQDRYLLALESKVFPVPPTAWFANFASTPLTELMQVGYFTFYVVFFLVGAPLYAKHRAAFHWMIATLVLGYLLCFTIYIGFPTEGPARTLAHLHPQPLRGYVFHWMVTFIQDQGGVHGNAFPSAHVAAGTVCALFAGRFLPRVARWLTPLIVLLGFGAVYDRYHYVSDVIGGIIIAFLAWRIMRVIEERPRLAMALRLPSPEDLHSSA
jgi:membrane-associated phospholipid phosphatase